LNDLEGGDADEEDEDDDDGLSGVVGDDEDAGRAIDAFGAHEGDLDEDEDEDGVGRDSAELLRRLEKELADERAAEEEDEEEDGDGDGFDAAMDDNADEHEDDNEDEVEDDNRAAGNADDEEAAAAAALARRKDYAPSVFQRAQTKLSRQIETLEELALQEKTWLLKGEASARERPKNSVLEADLEFEHVQAPPPVVSEEMTAKLEDLIKARIAEQRFDDVERVEPGLDSRAWQKLLKMSFKTFPNPRSSTLMPSCDVLCIFYRALLDGNSRLRALPELDDTISKKGLGDLYADDYVKAKSAAEGRAAAAAAEDKEEPLVGPGRNCSK